HHPGARAGARACQGDRTRAQEAEGPPDGDEHVRARRQGHIHGRRSPREPDRMTTRIDRRFASLKREGRAGLVTFVTAGDPDYGTSLAIVKAAPAAGADVVELGMPFPDPMAWVDLAMPSTDPMADGPSVQASSLRALKAGQTLRKTLDLVRAFRAGDAD